ncbi:hypothetical protein C8J57DRAFT_1229448 [Mycena rebaudengoi]|nr:hypothetical protein C8J57DRAFT_1229448 [Mycena rebaudengoi]
MSSLWNVSVGYILSHESTYGRLTCRRVALASHKATLHDAELLKALQDGPSVQSVLGRMSARQLVLAAASQPLVFSHVSRFVREKGEAACAIPEPRDGDSHFGRLPLDVATLILTECLDHVGQRVPFSGTSTRNRAIVALVLQQQVARQLGRYNLDFYDVRLLFCGTGTLLAGSVIPLLMAQTPFAINDLDFFAPAGQGHLAMRFLCMASSLTAARLPDAYESLAGICDIWELSGLSSTGQQCKINRTWAVLRKYSQRGFTYMTEFDRNHECGVHWSCPCTLRTTVDAGCLTAPLPVFPFPSAPPPHVSSWLLGVSTCSTNNQSNGSVIESAAFFRGIRYLLVSIASDGVNFTEWRWGRLFWGLLAMDTEPLDVSEVLN